MLGDAENLSLNATAAADGYEGGTNFVAANVVDGDDATRWASAAVQGSHWLSLDYGKEVTIQTFKIHWERTNPTNYRIEKSADGSNWETIVSFDSKPADYRQTIVLDEAINTQYVRLYVESFDPAGAPEVEIAYHGRRSEFMNLNLMRRYLRMQHRQTQARRLMQ